MSSLDSIMSLAADEMATSLSKTRAALSHNLTKGEASEETFRRFLRRHLPGSIGITKGQVIDSHGARSRQLDVILYDARRTPMLFTSEEDEHQLVPSEGVIAVFEVKTSLSASDLPGVVANMASVKSLDKSAYFYPYTPFVVEHQIYGAPHRVIPTMYFLFAFEGDDPVGLACRLSVLQDARPVKSRVDTACVLSRGVLINVTSDGNINGLPEPGSRLVGYASQRALLMFYLFFSRFVLQVEHFAINIQEYVPNTLAL